MKNERAEVVMTLLREAGCMERSFTRSLPPGPTHEVGIWTQRATGRGVILEVLHTGGIKVYLEAGADSNEMQPTLDELKAFLERK